MKKLIVYAALIIGVVGVIGAAIFAYMQQQELADKRAPMLASLKDPASAQFRNEHVVYRYGKLYLCGEVNSKNSLSGYVGFTRYVSHPEGYALDGYSIGTFYSNYENGDYISKELDIEIAYLKKLKRKPTQAEINKQAFSDLWDKYCL